MWQGLSRPRFLAGLFAILAFAATIAAAVTGGNDFYTVRVEDNPTGFGVGLYTVATGAMHPVTLAHTTSDILFGGTLRPGQSYTSIRSYTTGTDYLQNNGVVLQAGAPPTLILEDFVAAGEEAIPLGDPNHPSGYRTIYRIGDVAAASDSLLVVQTVEAVGATFNDSAVKIEMAITNTGLTSVEIGVRYLWDFRIGVDDGPTYRELNPDGAVETLEASSLDPLFETYEITDNNDAALCFTSVNPSVPLFSVQGSVSGPAALSPTAPSRLDFAAWPRVSGLPGLSSGAVPQPSAFGYVNTGVDATTCDISLDDTATIYWWGDDRAAALPIPPGGTVTVAAYLFGYLPGLPPTFPPPPVEICNDGLDNDGDGLVDGDDPDCPPPPVEICNDGIDNDGDGLIDEDDPDCPPPPVEICNDGIDNDGDGLIDEDDPDCPPPPVEICNDGIDNDGDGLIDEDDPDCPPPGGCDPERDPDCAPPPGGCDPEKNPDCPPPPGGCDPERDPDCTPPPGGCDPEKNPDCPPPPGGCDPERDPDCVPPPGGCDPERDPDCTPPPSGCDPERDPDCTPPSGDETVPSCLTRTREFYGLTRQGSTLLGSNASALVRFGAGDGLASLFPNGSLFPVSLGQGAFFFPDAATVTGTRSWGGADRGFLPGRAGRGGRRDPSNLLPNEALTLALTAGLSAAGADALVRADTDGDGKREKVKFHPGFLEFVVHWPGHFGDGMTVREVLVMADAAVASDASAAAAVKSQSQRHLVASRGRGQRGSSGANLVELLRRMNSSCPMPGEGPSGILRAP